MHPSNYNKYKMIAKQTNPAEIALDVMKAEMERAKSDVDELKDIKRELANEKRKHRHERIDKLASFYYKIATLLLASSVISCLSIFIKDSKVLINWQPAVFGLSASIFFIILANYVLIKNE